MNVVSAPLLEINGPNVPYETHLKDHDAHALMPAAKAYLKKIEDKFPGKKVYSDHVQVRRRIMGTEVYSTNASFVVLNKSRDEKDKGPFGSEKLYVMAAMENDLIKDLFQEFMDDEERNVVGVQEATLPYFRAYMQKAKNKDKTTCFYCHSDLEGSAIVVKDKLVSTEWKDGRNYWFSPDGGNDTHLQLGNHSFDTYLWSVCGVKGRTFSAVVLTLQNKDVLMLNMHSPNPAVAAEKVLKSEHPFTGMSNKPYEKHAFSRQHEWLQMLLTKETGPGVTGDVVRKIQAEYNRCERRLIIVGDFNDASRVYIGA